MLLKYLDSGAKYVRVLSSDLSKAFDNVPHDALFKNEEITSRPIRNQLVNEFFARS